MELFCEVDEKLIRRLKEEKDTSCELWSARSAMVLMNPTSGACACNNEPARVVGEQWVNGLLRLGRG